MKRWLRQAYGLVNETLDQYSKDGGERAAAALAFYTLLSIAPLIIIAVAIAGAFLGRATAEREVLRVLTDTMGPNAAATVQSWVRQADDSGGIASVVGFVLVLLAASRLGAQLRLALNQVWNVDAYQAEGFKATVRDHVKRRLFAFLLVAAAGPLLLAVFVSRTLLTALNDVLFASAPGAATLAGAAQLSFSFIVVAAISALVFRVVPDTRVGWRAVVPGALLTSALFNVGNWLVGLYLGRATVAQTYGAAGSAVVVLLWLYFSAQMFLLGAEFTQVYATHFGRGLNQKEEAEVSAAARAGERAASASGANTSRPNAPTAC
jgi:membrane protein